MGPVGNFEEGDTVSLHNISSKSSNSTFKIGSLICYEDIFPSLARATALAGAEFIFVATNDAWFGEEGCAEQHAAHSVFGHSRQVVPFFAVEMLDYLVGSIRWVDCGIY